MAKEKGKVFVGMSGGVDSSVAAALLKKAGFNVVGIYMKCWSAELSPSCTANDDERMARLAASHLGIPFYVWNFIDEYKKRVVDYMIEGYRNGVTPNPDMMCNKEIKFGLFFDKAMALGADYVATGHYARIQHVRNISSASSAKPPLEKARPLLLTGKDSNKDQSYFLAFIKAEVLDRVLFPIGNYTKPEVREMARKFGLPNAERKDSQGICFVGEVNVVDFLRQYIKPKKGEIVDTQGRVLGAHEGVMYYTVGQRQGIGLAEGPWYVVSKDLKNNRLVVSKDEGDLIKTAAVVRNVNWFSRPDTFPADLTVHLRYRHEGIKAKVEDMGNGTYRLQFATPQRAVTPGQFAVFYHSEELLGGGVIA
ncbi:MAG: tRNA 2-thiouridine(34) synthase MnmA [Candidatus Wildermuthbacteria bacterium]|nr:tRNA 2-thiouridine(34) synthase MnmA [Candidatus Wildermuthbacteria bacterium]